MCGKLLNFSELEIWQSIFRHKSRFNPEIQMGKIAKVHSGTKAIVKSNNDLEKRVEREMDH